MEVFTKYVKEGDNASFDLWFLFNVSFSFSLSSFGKERHSDRHKDSRSNLRLPSQSATYTVSAWHHLPEKLILDSCGYEATVSQVLLSNKKNIIFIIIYNNCFWSNIEKQSCFFAICYLHHVNIHFETVNESTPALLFLLVPRINDNQGSTRDWVHTRCLC